MIATPPVSLPAQDTAAAILRSNGSVLLNQNSAPTSSALYRDDVIETQKGGAARIEATGSAADLNPETMLQFEVDELALDHGSLSVNTSRGWRVRIGCVTVTPVNAAEWTHYEVADVDGKITVSASKSDVYIESRSSNRQPAATRPRSDRVIVHQGEQKSRGEKCAAADLKQGRAPGQGPTMDSVWAKVAAGVGVGGLAFWVLCRSDDPISPSAPSPPDCLGH
ncbi:MAG: hypothetical protein WAN03_15750 [Candidatus Sulfotelmatobacter sp.]